MALSVRADGLEEENKVVAAWWNDYYDLLTGAMHDQAVILNYRPGSGTNPTLLLKGDGSGPLLRGLKTDDTTDAFKFDSSGNMTIAGLGTSGGFTLARFRALGDGVSAGVNIWIIPEGGDDPTEEDGLQDGDLVFTVATS